MPTPANVTLPTGTTATLAVNGGSASALTKLKSIGGNTRTTNFADITALADTEIQRIPSRIDPGTVQITGYVNYTTDNYATFKTAQDNHHVVSLAIDLPGSASPSPTFVGYVSDVSTPEIAAGDDGLTFTATIQISSATL